MTFSVSNKKSTLSANRFENPINTQPFVVSRQWSKNEQQTITWLLSAAMTAPQDTGTKCFWTFAALNHRNICCAGGRNYYYFQLNNKHIHTHTHTTYYVITTPRIEHWILDLDTSYRRMRRGVCVESSGAQKHKTILKKNGEYSDRTERRRVWRRHEAV